MANFKQWKPGAGLLSLYIITAYTICVFIHTKFNIMNTIGCL